MRTSQKTVDGGEQLLSPKQKKPKKAQVVRKSVKKSAPAKKPAGGRMLQKPKQKKEESGSSENTPVFVPSTASLRLLEKVELYSLWYQKEFPAYVSAAAKAGGYAFLAVGAILSSGIYLWQTGTLVPDQSAALVCTKTTCTEVPDSALTADAPRVSFLNTVPAVLEMDVDFSISLTNASSAKVVLIALQTGTHISLEPIEHTTSAEHKYLIPGRALQAGFYTLTASALTPQGDEYIFTGPTFTKLESGENTPKEAALPIVSESELVSEEITATDTLPPEIDAETTPPEVPKETEDPTVDDAPQADTPDVESEEQEPEPTGEESAAGANAPFTLTLHNEGGTEYVSVVSTLIAPERVELYSEMSGASESLYLGQATRVQEEWVFSLSALELPKREHLLYAALHIGDKKYQTEGLVYDSSKNRSENTLTGEDLEGLVQKIELALLSSSVTNQNRQSYFSYLTTQTTSLFSSEDEKQFSDTTLTLSINTALESAASTLDPLLLNFAAAVQAGSPYVIALAATELDEHYKELASVIAAERGDTTIVPSIHTILKERYRSLKDAVRNTEEQIKQDTNNLTARDTDGDGISDFDEVAIFKTNPAVADTDEDSVLDGVEIVTNSNPQEADFALRTQLRTQVEDITLDEVVQVSDISPRTLYQQDQDKEVTQVVITGSAIPHSYVYIFSPSTDSIGVIKTNQAGTFSYTLEKAIPEGKHEIVALLVDSNGRAVASSRPYWFEKTSDDFLVASAISSIENLVPESDEEAAILYLLVATVGVITFGFILLMLATTVRNRKDKVAKLR